MKEINLDKIINYYNESNILPEHYHKDDIKYMLRLFGKQLLELAAENSKIQEVINDDLDNLEISDYLVSYDDFGTCYTQSVNKQSILDTINQVK